MEPDETEVTLSKRSLKKLAIDLFTGDHIKISEHRGTLIDSVFMKDTISKIIKSV